MANVTKLGSILVFFIFNIPILILSIPLVPCYFIFGDSLVDNGNNNNLRTVTKVNYPPYGIDFRDGPTGRFSNGRNLADFIAIQLGFSNYIQPYATVKDNDITRGVNYASGGAGILQDSATQLGEVIYFDKQLQHHQIAISRITTIQGNASFTEEYLRKCIYTVGMGNNDYIQNYFSPEFHNTSRLFSADQFATILIAQYSKQLQTLYNLGARKIAVFGLLPSGCTPAQVAKFGTNGTQCVTKINDAVKLFNDKLQPLADCLNSKFTDAKFIVVAAISTVPSIPGILISNSPCCKVSMKGVTRGQCIANLPPCPLRLQYTFFDGFHPTESAYFFLAQLAYLPLVALL